MGLLRIALLLAALLAPASGFAVHGACRRSPAAAVTMKMAIRTNDVVKVISGDDKGSTGKVLMLDKKKGKIIVEGINVRTKHVKPMKEGESGSILKKEQPIDMSNVVLT